MRQEYYSVKDLMIIFGVKKPDTIWKRIHNGEIEAVRIGNQYRIHRKAIRQFHRNNIVVAKKK